MPDPDYSLMAVWKRQATLAGGGGGSDDGGNMLDQRVATLEADMREVKRTLLRLEQKLDKTDARFDKIDGRLEKFDERMRKIEVDVARIDGRLSLMPSTYTMIMTMVALSFSILGGVLAIFRFAGPG
jgi:chromosome segregation ATPase